MIERKIVTRDHISLLVDIAAHYSRKTSKTVTVAFDQKFGTEQVKELTSEYDNNAWIIIAPEADQHHPKPVHWLEWLLFSATELLSRDLKEEYYDLVLNSKKHPINKMHHLLFPARYVVQA